MVTETGVTMIMLVAATLCKLFPNVLIHDTHKQRIGYSKYDFIFTHDSIEVLQHGIIDDRIWDNYFQKELYPSDHRPVLSDLKFKKS